MAPLHGALGIYTTLIYHNILYQLLCSSYMHSFPKYLFLSPISRPTVFPSLSLFQLLACTYLKSLALLPTCKEHGCVQAPLQYLQGHCVLHQNSLKLETEPMNFEIKYILPYMDKYSSIRSMKTKFILIS